MTTTTTPPPVRRPAPPDAHSAQRLRALTLVGGGVAFAVGNLLHPLEHSDAAMGVATWEAAHLVYALGCVLIAAGIGALRPRLGHLRAGRLALGLTWLGVVMVIPTAYVEVYIAPAIGQERTTGIDESAVLWGLATFVPYAAGPALLAFVGLRHRLFPRLLCAGLVLQLVLVLLLPGLPGKEGVWLIPATALLGLSLAWAGWLSRSDR